MKVKNFFFSMLAMTGMLFATSCSQDELLNEPLNDEFVNATFTIGTTDGIGTRAVTIGTASKINWVACAIYDAEGEKMNLDQTVPFENGQATYNVRLAKGQDYRAVFFAYCGDADTKESSYYNLSDLTYIQILIANSNIEERDAFTAFEPISADDLTNLKTVTKSVVLKRPFAQLNLGISSEEVEAAKNAGVEVAQTKIVVSDVYSAFNAYENNVVVSSLGSMEFNFNAIPDEDLVVNGDEYEYLALNYLLVGDMGTEKSLTDVYFYWKNEDGSKYNDPETHFITIPVQRNYRTNILGRLLTTPSEFNITIDSDFVTPDGYVKDLDVIATVNVANATDLQTALDNAAQGGQTVIVLSDDITGDVKVTQKSGVDILINGNNKKFTGILTTYGNGRQAGTEALTIKNVNFVAANGADACILSPDRSVNNSYSYAHNVTVANCTFTDPDGTVNCAAVRHNDGGDEYWTIRECNIDNTMHSIIQTNNVNGKLTIDKCEVYSKNGANLNSCTNVDITGCTFDVKGYAVRFGVATGGNYGVAKTYSIANSTLKSSLDDPDDAVIMFRASARDAKLTLTNTTVTGTTQVSGNTSETTIIGLN